MVKKEREIKILAEKICKFCAEEKLTISDISSALDIVLEKYYADATI